MSSTSVTPWIISFLKESLTTYLDQIELGGDTKDDGDCVSFQSNGLEPWSYILSWGVSGTGHFKAVLMDPECQINADIFDDPQVQAPNNIIPKHFRIKLLDFKLVLKNPSSHPELYLHATRFRIDWEHGAQRLVAPAGLRKNKTSKALLDKVSGRLKAASTATKPKSPIKLITASASFPQNDPLDVQAASFSQISTQHLQSQALPNDDQKQERPGGSINRLSTNDLLQRLYHEPKPIMTSTDSKTVESSQPSHTSRQASGPQGLFDIGAERTFFDQTTPQKDDRSRESSFASQPGQPAISPLRPCADDSTSKSLITSRSPTATDEFPQENNAASGSHTTTDAVTPKPASPNLKKRRRASDDDPSVKNSDEGDSTVSMMQSPSKKQRLGEHAEGAFTPPPVPRDEAPEIITRAVELESIRVPAQLEVDNEDLSPRPDPWEGLVRIEDVQVFIPKDQRALFESPNEAWIPPKPGQPMPHAHVPPSLLRTWNNFAVQKKRDAETREVAAEQHLPQTQETYEFMDSDQESRLSWSLSPERTNSPSGLPPSSPVKNVSARYNRELKSGEKPTVGEPLTGIFEGNAAAAVNHESQQNHSEAMSQNIARQPTPEKKQVGRPVINNETSIEAWPSLPVDTSRREADEQQSSPGQGSQSRHLEATHKSSTPSSPPVSIIDPPNIESDNESMMESSVPLALGEVLPDPTQSSQTGKDFRSSGTSLSGSKERVQVSETPALSKGLIKGAEPTSSNSYPSPHAHKISSSQSRILNTLPSHASYEGAQSSNEAPNFTQSEGSEAIRVDSSWTQPQASMNSTSQSQDASTNSQSDVVLDSSGPAQPHQIFSASHTGSHGHPPPSVDELGSHDHSQSQPMDTTQTSPLPNEEVKALVGGNPCPYPVQEADIIKEEPRTALSIKDLLAESPQSPGYSRRLFISQPVSDITVPGNVLHADGDKVSDVSSEPAKSQAPASEVNEPETEPDDHLPVIGTRQKALFPKMESPLSRSHCVHSRSTTGVGAETDTNEEEIDETDMEDIDEFDDTRHETASVELGDESFVSNAGQLAAESASSESEVEDECESEDENWFVSLRHLRQQRPAWSDDPNTPFKRWAEAELNSLRDRTRRGGAKVLLDEKGVVRRLTNR